MEIQRNDWKVAYLNIDDEVVDERLHKNLTKQEVWYIAQEEQPQVKFIEDFIIEKIETNEQDK